MCKEILQMRFMIRSSMLQSERVRNPKVKHVKAYTTKQAEGLSWTHKNFLVGDFLNKFGIFTHRWYLLTIDLSVILT